MLYVFVCFFLSFQFSIFCLSPLLGWPLQTGPSGEPGHAQGFLLDDSAINSKTLHDMLYQIIDNVDPFNLIFWCFAFVHLLKRRRNVISGIESGPTNKSRSKRLLLSTTGQGDEPKITRHSRKHFYKKQTLHNKKNTALSSFDTL